MLEVHCSGSPREIGFQHGKLACEQILRGLDFYTAYYVEKAGLEWPQAVEAALNFAPTLERDWPDLVTEMRGVAEGAGLPFEDILTMNVRSEISMGMMTTTDGCTSLSYHSQSTSLLAQNWDWDVRQQSNIIALTLHPTSGPIISMVTEAGLIGKIGLNSHSVGVCLNAIRVPGVTFSRLPLHLALRVALNSTSAAAAIATLDRAGVASARHILVADAEQAVGLEWSHLGATRSVEPHRGVVTHTNHFLRPVPAGASAGLGSVLEDSPPRMVRIVELLSRRDPGQNDGLGADQSGGKELSIADVEGILDDEQGFPCSINRSSVGGHELQTLFSIVMDLRDKRGYVRVGRPTEGGERIVLRA